MPLKHQLVVRDRCYAAITHVRTDAGLTIVKCKLIKRKIQKIIEEVGRIALTWITVGISTTIKALNLKSERG